MTATAHLQPGLGHRQRIAWSPVARGVDPQPLGPVRLHDVRRPLRRALGLGVERHARPETPVEHQRRRVLLDVVDENPAAIQGGVVPDRVDDEPRALELVLQVRRVDQDELVPVRGEVKVRFEDLQLVAAVLVQADFADTIMFDRTDGLPGPVIMNRLGKPAVIRPR